MSKTDPQSLILPREALLAAVQAVGSVVERRNTIPILANVLLKAAGGELMLRGTDLDIEATAVLPAEGALSATVSAGLLQDILRKLPEKADVALTPGVDKGAFVLRSGRARFTLQTLPEEDFPSLQGGEWKAAFDIPAADLAELLGRCDFAISTEETRYYLNGVYLHTVADEGAEPQAGGSAAQSRGGHKLTAVATDGHRLARLRRDAPAGAAGMPGVIIPRKTVGQMLRDLKAAGKDEIVRLQVSAVKIAYRSQRLALVSKLIDGTFPDYTRVIPVANDKRLVLERDALIAAVERVSTVTSERGRAVKCELEDGRLTLSVTNPDAGAASEELEADYDSPALTTGFNARYLQDILGEIDSDTVLVKLADPSSPTVFQSREGADALFVLMPMRV